jgi:hypothetical protein
MAGRWCRMAASLAGRWTPACSKTVLPFFSSPWLSPLLSFISSSLPLLLPFYLSTFSSFQPHSREFAISP